MVMTSSRPPGVGVMCFASTSSTTLTGRSFKSATRSRSAGSNSISPRIARSVIPATCAFSPANSLDLSKAVLIAGPTAGGKPALALELAQKSGGIVINTDSRQVYRDLRIITARPTVEEEARAPHRLYGHVDASVNFSAGAWVADAAKVLADARAAGRLPIFIGGSGLYFKALTHGLSAVPPIPAEVRNAVRDRLERSGVEALHAELARRDPASAERLKPRDRTRIARALEVIEATGRSLPDWHREGQPPLLGAGEFSALFLAPERAALYARIDARFDGVVADGAVGEVAALSARK